MEPEDSQVLSGGRAGQHMIQGIGAGFIPKNCNTQIIDEVITVENEDAFATAQESALKDGLSVGISSGATIWAAIEIAKRPEMAGKRIVTIAASGGERYISTPLGEVARAAAAEAVVS